MSGFHELASPIYLPITQSSASLGERSCHLWRNWDDIQCNWNSLSSIIDHWGDYTAVLQAAAAPGHWNDPDMLLVGAEDASGESCLSIEEERTQMSIWALVAAPLIMGNDVRKMRDASRDLLLNKGVIAIDQDALGQQGGRLTSSSSAWQQARRTAYSDARVRCNMCTAMGGHKPRPACAACRI